MKKILCPVLAVFLVLLCGCSAFLEKEYLSVTDYDSAANRPDVNEVGTISSYSALMDTLEKMVEQHQGSAQLQFNNYAGNISDDLAEASWQLKQNSALGAYMVDYISYDISRIVTYYQATVYINYTRSAEEMESIHSIGANKIADTVVEAVSAGQKSLALQIYTTVIDGADMARRIESALLDAPGKVPVIPSMDVTVYSGQDSHDIFEVTFDYGESDVAESVKKLESRVKEISSDITQEEDYSIAILAAGALGEVCVYDGSFPAGTAYNALVEGRGDSRAVSMAYTAICMEKGVQSRVVSGLKNNELHYWSLVKIGDYWYHADVSEAIGLPAETVFLRTDSEMVRSFRWDELDYPACDGISLIRSAQNDSAKKVEEN